MEFIIDFTDTATDADVQSYLGANQCTVLQTYNSFAKVYLVDAPATPPVTGIVTSIINNHETVIAPLLYDDNSAINLDLTSESEWWKTVSIKNIDLTASSAMIMRRGRNACVYVMDSGINAGHPEFADASITSLYSFNGDNQDYNGHGTAIASVISGMTCGMTSAKLKSVKIFQSGVPTYQSHILAALDAIYQDVMSNYGQFSVVNMSWAVPKNEYIEGKIRALALENVWLVCAAGNSGQPLRDLTPASMPETLTIGAYNRELEPCDFSNYPSDIINTSGQTNTGPLWVWAPGEHIRAAYGSGYGIVAGTSIAAAIASASLAYNSWNILLDNATVPMDHDRYNIYARNLTWGNLNLVNLSDPYATSSVHTATFNAYKFGEVIGMNLPGGSYKVLVKSGEAFQIQVLDPMYESEIISMDPLPPGLEMNGNFLQGSMITDSYFTRRIAVRTLLHTGQPFTRFIALYVTSDQYTPETVPPQDQLMSIEVLLSQCCTNDVGFGCTTGTQCVSCFNCGDKNIPQCINICDAPCNTQVCP